MVADKSNERSDGLIMLDEDSLLAANCELVGVMPDIDVLGVPRDALRFLSEAIWEHELLC